LEALRLAKPTLDAETWKSAEDLYGKGLIDSFDILVILDELNAAFNMNLTANDFSRADFRTVESIYAMVQRHVGHAK
jgi:acyl carrier protein